MNTLTTEQEISDAKRDLAEGMLHVCCHGCILAQDILDDCHEKSQKLRFQRMNSHEFLELE